MAPIAARTPETVARATGGSSTASLIRDRISGGSSSTHYAVKERHVIPLVASVIRLEKFMLRHTNLLVLRQESLACKNLRLNMKTRFELMKNDPMRRELPRDFL